MQYVIKRRVKGTYSWREDFYSHGNEINFWEILSSDDWQYIDKFGSKVEAEFIMADLPPVNGEYVAMTLADAKKEKL